MEEGFFLANFDMDCSLANPSFAMAHVFSMLLFGAWLARVFFSRRTALQKALRLGAVLALSYVGAQLADIATLVVLNVQVRREVGPGAQVGCMTRTPSYLGTVGAVGCAAIFCAAVTVWRRRRPLRTL